ncbi:Uncharacterised protein [Campylobacter geochelonis]|nr:Uncharacterised protein [Campylobacter geochelonis]CZE49913.1 Uncharacterised protein [Campylobacter geochelonis]
MLISPENRTSNIDFVLDSGEGNVIYDNYEKFVDYYRYPGFYTEDGKIVKHSIEDRRRNIFTLGGKLINLYYDNIGSVNPLYTYTFKKPGLSDDNKGK